MERRSRWIWTIVVLAVAIGVLVFVRSPSGEAARQAVDDVSDQVTGNRAVKESERVREELDRIDASRMRQLEEIEESR